MIGRTNSAGGGGSKIENALEISLKAAENIEKSTLVGAKINLISAKNNEGYFIPYYIQSLPHKVDETHFIIAGHGYNSNQCYAQICTVATNGVITGETKLQLSTNTSINSSAIVFNMGKSRFLYHGLIGASNSYQLGLLAAEADNTVTLKSSATIQYNSSATIAKLDESRFFRMYVDNSNNTFKVDVYNVNNDTIALEGTYELKTDTTLNAEYPTIRSTKIDDYTFFIKYYQYDLKFTKAFVAKYNPTTKTWTTYETLVISSSLQVSGLDINVDGATVLMIDTNNTTPQHCAIDISEDYSLSLRQLSGMQDRILGSVRYSDRILVGFDRTSTASDAKAVLCVYIINKNGVYKIDTKLLETMSYSRFSNGFMKFSEDTFIGYPYGSDHYFGVLKFDMQECYDGLIPIGVAKNTVAQGSIGQVLIKE